MGDKISLAKPKIIKFEWDFPLDFVVVIDTREQDQLFKRPTKGLVIVRNKLEAGDYSVRGFESSISIERKHLSDLHQSLGRERERFKRELERLKLYECKWLVIEANEDECLSFQHFGGMHPNAIRQSLASIECRYGIAVHYQPDRRKLERWVLDRLLRFYRIKRGD